METVQSGSAEILTKPSPPQTDRSSSGQPIGLNVARNGAWNMFSAVVPAAATTVASIVMARRLGPSEFGDYVLAVFAYSTAASLAVWGLREATVRYLAVARAGGRPDEERAIVGHVVRVAAGGAIAAAGGLASLAVITGGDDATLWTLAALVVLPLAPTTVLASVLSGQERYRSLAGWQLIVGLANPVVTVGAVASGAGVTEVLIIDIVLTAAGLAALLLLVRPLPLRGVSRMPKGFWAFAARNAVLMTIGVIVFQRSEVIFLDLFYDRRDVAVYGVAFGLSQLVWRGISPLLAVLLPAFSRQVAMGTLESGGTVQRSASAALALGLVASAVGAVLAPAAIELLYGEAFSAAAAPAQIMLGLSWAAVLGTTLSTVATARDDLRLLLWIGGTAVGINLLLDLALIPPFSALGAALANSGAQLLVTLLLVAWWCRVSSTRLGGLREAVLPAAAAAAVAAPFQLLAPPFALALGGLAALAAAAVVGRWSGAMDDDALSIVVSLCRRLVRRPGSA